MRVLYKELAKYYDLIYRNKDYTLETEYLHKFFKRYNVRKILDAACGTGNHDIYLVGRYNVTGIDLSKELLKIARKKVKGATYYQMNMKNFNLNRQFDAVTCLDVIEHFRKKDRLAVLKNLDRHLKKGGLLILAFPSKFYIDVVEKVWKIVRRTLHPKITFDDEGIHDAVDAGEIKDFLKNKGYKIKKEGLSSFYLIKYMVFKK